MKYSIRNTTQVSNNSLNSKSVLKALFGFCGAVAVLVGVTGCNAVTTAVDECARYYPGANRSDERFACMEAARYAPRLRSRLNEIDSTTTGPIEQAAVTPALEILCRGSILGRASAASIPATPATIAACATGLRYAARAVRNAERTPTRNTRGDFEYPVESTRPVRGPRGEYQVYNNDYHGTELTPFNRSSGYAARRNAGAAQVGPRAAGGYETQQGTLVATRANSRGNSNDGSVARRYR